MMMKLPRVLYILACLIFLPTLVQAQTTFNVVIQPKSTSHPNFGQGHPDAYVIDGVEANTLTLMRGVTYTFQMDNVSSIHPFYISTSNVGGGGGAFDDGVAGNFATGNDVLTFTPDANTPDELFYQCGIHAFMGGQINIVGTGTDTDDVLLPTRFALRGNYPNPFQEETTLRFDLPRDAEVQVQVFNMLGQETLSLRPRRMSAGTSRSLTIVAADLLPGLYIYRVTIHSGGKEQVQSGRMVLLK